MRSSQNAREDHNRHRRPKLDEEPIKTAIKRAISEAEVAHLTKRRFWDKGENALLATSGGTSSLTFYAYHPNRIRGYISTLRKQGYPMLSALQSLFFGEPYMPRLQEATSHDSVSVSGSRRFKHCRASIADQVRGGRRWCIADGVSEGALSGLRRREDQERLTQRPDGGPVKVYLAASLPTVQ